MSPEKIIVVVLLVSIMLHAGLQVNIEHLTAVLKNYSLLARAFLANFILVPIYGVALVRLFHLQEPIAIGILLMACAPGVPFVLLQAGRKKGGSLGFGICLAFLMPLVSLITVPITLPLVLPANAAAHIPTASLVTNIVLFQLIPLLVGLAICQRAPSLAEKLTRPVGLLMVLTILALLAVLFPAIIRAVSTVYGSYGMITALLVVLLSVVTGWLLGGPDPSYRRTLAIGTDLRNIGLASLVATTDFPRTSVGAMVICYFIVQFVVGLLAGRTFAKHMEEPTAPAVASR
jgi:bile acid:Na+ symporter, BASS family